MNLFFDLQMDLHFVSLKNNLTIILSSRSENFKNIKAQLKVRYSYKKSVCSSFTNLNYYLKREIPQGAINMSYTARIAFITRNLFGEHL